MLHSLVLQHMDIQLIPLKINPIDDLCQYPKRKTCIPLCERQKICHFHGKGAILTSSHANAYPLLPWRDNIQ